MSVTLSVEREAELTWQELGLTADDMPAGTHAVTAQPLARQPLRWQQGLVGQQLRGGWEPRFIHSTAQQLVS